MHTLDSAAIARALDLLRGPAAPANDLNHDGVVNVLDVQIVINAALGLGCAAL